MKANDRERQRQRIEDEIIDAIDSQRRIKSPIISQPDLRVPIIDLIVYRAIVLGMPVKCGGWDKKRSVAADAVIS